MAFDAFWDLYALSFARLEKRRAHDHFIVRDMHDKSCVGIWKDESGRIDIDALWHRFIADQKTNA
jgi:hypothetical protein